MTTKRLAIALMALTCSALNASAFYFPGWPGASRPPAPTLLQSYTPGDPPSVTPPTPPEKITVDPPPTSDTPEPATLVMVGLGLGVIAMRKLKR
ncbi:hypothetical protein BH11PLA2_BH11PLA2_22920 [soil metagenome]